MHVVTARLLAILPHSGHCIASSMWPGWGNTVRQCELCKTLILEALDPGGTVFLYHVKMDSRTRDTEGKGWSPLRFNFRRITPPLHRLCCIPFQPHPSSYILHAQSLRFMLSKLPYQLRTLSQDYCFFLVFCQPLARCFLQPSSIKQSGLAYHFGVKLLVCMHFPRMQDERLQPPGAYCSCFGLAYQGPWVY